MTRKLHSLDKTSTKIVEEWKKVYLAKTPSEAVRAVQRELIRGTNNEKKFKFKL